MQFLVHRFEWIIDNYVTAVTKTKCIPHYDGRNDQLNLPAQWRRLANDYIHDLADKCMSTQISSILH